MRCQAAGVGVKVFTLHQPWASLVALGVKTIETRSWSTKYRGPLAIHSAAKKPRNVWAQEPPDVYDPIAMDRYLEISEDVHGTGSFLYEWRGPLGTIVATCTLVDVVPMVAERGCADVPGKGPLITVSRTGEHVTGLKWQNTVSPTRYIDKEFCERLRADRPYGLYEPGRFAWLLADVVPVDPPAPFKGGQGLTKTWEP